MIIGAINTARAQNNQQNADVGVTAAASAAGPFHREAGALARDLLSKKTNTVLTPYRRSLDAKSFANLSDAAEKFKKDPNFSTGAALRSAKEGSRSASVVNQRS